MWNEIKHGSWQQKRSLMAAISLCMMVIWSIAASAQSEFTYSTQNDAGGDISITNLGDFYPGVHGESSYQSLILANSDFLYSVQAIERSAFDGDFILHRYDGDIRTEVTRLPFPYDLEVGIPRYVSQKNKVVFFAYGMEEDFLVFDGASEEISLFSIDGRSSHSESQIFGVSNGFTFVGSTYTWGENDGQNIDTVFRLSQDENIAIELPIDDGPLDQQVTIFSDGIYVKGDTSYILLDNSTSVAELTTLEAPQYLFEWRDKLIFQEGNSENIVWLDKQSLELQNYPGHMLGVAKVGEDFKALVKVGEQTQLWTFASDGSWITQNLTLPDNLSSNNIMVNGATLDSIYFVSASDSQAGRIYSWWRLHLDTLESNQLTTLPSISELRFNSINNTAFLWQRTDLWRSNGSEDSTQKVIFPEGVTSEGLSISQFDDKLLIVSNSSQFGREWLVVDEQGNSQVLDNVPGAVGSGVFNYPGRNIIFKDRFYALQNIPSTGNELYVYSDLGSPPTLVYDLTPNAIGYSSMTFSPSVGVLENQIMIFVDSLYTDMGKQLFFTDGTPENSGILPDDPNADYRVFGNHYYRKEPQSISRFNQETQTFESVVTLPEGTMYYNLIGVQNESLIYSIYSNDPQQQELFISNENTVKSIFTGNTSYLNLKNGNLYFHHRLEPDSNRRNVYRYNIDTDELSQLLEVEATSEFRVVGDNEVLFTYNQDGYLQVSKLNENDELVSVFTNPENERYEAEYSLLNGKVILVEKDPDLQPFMNRTGMFLLNIATSELETLPITERLATQQYSINYHIHNGVISAVLRNANNDPRECFIFNQEEMRSGNAYCNIEAYEIGEDILILSVKQTSVSRDNYENYVQVLDENLNVLFDYQTSSTWDPRQKRYKLANEGLLYHIGNEEREELWWKGTRQKAPIKILNNFNELLENTGLNSLRDVSWRAVNGRLLMRGEEDSIGAEPFVLDLYVNPQLQLLTTSAAEEGESHSMSITPGTTVEMEFAIKSMLPLQTADIQLSDVPGIAMQLTKEEGLFTLRLEVANDFNGTEELTLTVNGEGSDVFETINLEATDNTPPAPPLSDTSSSGSGGSSSWIFILFTLAWLRRAAQLKAYLCTNGYGMIPRPESAGRPKNRIRNTPKVMQLCHLAG